MGMNSTDLDLLLLLKHKGHIVKPGNVIEIGAQQCSNSFLQSKKQIAELGKLFQIDSNFNLCTPSASVYEKGLELLNVSAPPTSSFWKWLGFNYKSLDFDESYDSFFIDLNYDDVPDYEIGKYDLVTNYGTTEHVVNQLNAFKIIHDLTAAGGIMIHNVPAQGYQNHGLINYNAKFFWMLARSNQYEWLFSDYALSNVYQELHKDIVEEVAKFCPDIKHRGKTYKMSDGAIRVALKKNLATPYVPPLDVNTGTKIKNESMKKRYWSVLG